MKKIMFNDKYGLTEAVLEGRKTQTRRIIKCPNTFKGEEVRGFYVYKREADSEIAMYACMHDADGFDIEGGELLPRYEVGEIVAVAQSYANCGNMPDCELDEDGYPIMPKNSGYFNKMFVKADLMPYRIKVTNVWMERLQSISEEECLAEGIIKRYHAPVGRNFYYVPNVESQSTKDVHLTARLAYENLIDKVSGKGTWESNPWVWVYEFELVESEEKK